MGRTLSALAYVRMISIPAAAALLGISRQRVHALCAARRIPGARRFGGPGGVWRVPNPPTVIAGTRGPRRKIIALAPTWAESNGT